jgi:hypothetical protein
MNLEKGGGDLFVPRSGTYRPYSSVFFSLFCFGGEGEDRGCLDDKEDVNGLEVRSGLSVEEARGHSNKLPQII